jgi:hypothetical protein
MADLAELRRSADRLRGLEDQAADERAIRNALIRELMDQGHRYREVAQAARVSVSGVQGIITADAA